VSVATLQLAVSAGASVVATTSSREKEVRLKALGALHTVDYRSNPETWGEMARSLTPEGRGFDIVVDVGGDETLSQSLKAVRVDGIVVLVGDAGHKAAPIPLFAAFMHTCTVRAILGGSRTQVKQVVQLAYRRLHDKKHFAKVVIRVDQKEE
jgi:NADPH:quinone reductase-like Zn-dependent oxidoreductase